MCLIVPYYYKKVQHERVVYYENQGPLCETSNVWWRICLSLEVLWSNQNSKSKDPIVQFIFLNIHISHKTRLAMNNMPLKWYHISMYIYKYILKHDLTWFLTCCVMILPIQIPICHEKKVINNVKFEQKTNPKRKVQNNTCYTKHIKLINIWNNFENLSQRVKTH
jgi:hypothetical protein